MRHRAGSVDDNIAVTPYRGYLHDISEQEIDLGFDSGIPPPADYELISPAGAPVEVSPGDINTNSAQHVQHFPQSISANNIQVEEANIRRTSLQVSASLARERRASLQLVISDAIHTKTSHSHHRHHHRHSHSQPRKECIRPWEPSADGKPMYDGPDLPSADLPEDHTGLEPMAMPLDASKISTHILGYETTCHSSRDCGPSESMRTLKDLETDGELKPLEEYTSCAHIDEGEAKEALLHFVGAHCCYGKKPARNMSRVKIVPSSTLRYTLETYTETRCTKWEQEPFRGQEIDGPMNGPAPSPWSIPCAPSEMFQDEIHDLEVPHTSHVIACHGCNSLGWVRCHSCLGRGYKCCLRCQGTGRDWKTDVHGHGHIESCWQCHGTGRKRCLQCDGDGRVVCRTCQGYKQLKCSIRITVNFTNNRGEHVVEKSDIPEELVQQVSGEVVFEQVRPRVWPVSNYPDKELCVASQNLIEDHWDQFRHTQIIMQRHCLRAVPVTECQYNWQDCQHKFWVYGVEKAVYTPDYPQKYCCGCVLL
ncbi:hypothetical protein LSAT2_029584 [Lamellibrachia satsuma]|nr:hypothetical protein LSAT2_029584 [Lamellibrachia satsuma]